MRIKLLTGVAGENESHLPGDLVDRPENVAREWIAAGLAIEAPEADLAAARVAELSEALAGASAERDGLAKQVTELSGKLAAAAKEKQGATAEADVHRKAAEAARTQTNAVVETFEKYKVATAMRMKAVEDERDEFKRQAEALAEQLVAKPAVPAP
jgi:chromosome segregation ATPase